MMKERSKLLLIILLLSFCLTADAQSDTALQSVTGNACGPYFNSKEIPIHYTYTESSQTHDYSNNWDFDGDGKTDGLYFIGTGGAHLYFYLRIILSSDKKIRNFSFLELDIPCLGSIGELKNSSPFPQFVVDKFIPWRRSK